MSELVTIPDSALREKRRVLLALPWYRTASPLATVALLHLFQKDCMGASISFGDAFIVHARNKLATKFLASKFDWMLTLDSDTVPPCGNATWFNENAGLKLPEWAAGLNVIDRLVSHGKTLVGATYFGRSPDAPPIFAEGIQRRKELLRSGPIDQVIPTKWVGTGCLLIHRRVFEDIEKKFPHLSRAENNGMGQWFTSSEHDLRMAVERAATLIMDDPVTAAGLLKEGLHRASIHSPRGVGEDVIFCVRAQQSGHPAWVDLGCWAAHIGDATYPRR